MKNDDAKKSPGKLQQTSTMHKSSDKKNTVQKNKITTDKQKQLDKLTALEQEAAKLKAKEFRTAKTSLQTENADIVADKSVASMAQQETSSDEAQVASESGVSDEIILEQLNPQEAPQQVDPVEVAEVANTDTLEVESESAEIAQAGQRIGKGGGVTTPVAITFDITNGIKGGIITGGLIATSKSKVPDTPDFNGTFTVPHNTNTPDGNITPTGTAQHIPQLSPQLTPGQLPDKVVQQTPDLTLPPQLTPGQVPDKVVQQTPDPTLPPQLTQGQVPDKVVQQTPDPTLPPQLTPGQVPDKVVQQTPDPTLPPQLTPGQVPDKVVQQTPDPTLPPQLTPGKVPYQVPQAIPNAIPTAVPDKIPQPMHQEVPLAAAITIDAITKDNIVNALEAKANVYITGHVGGDVIDGDVIILTVNGHTYSGQVSGSTFAIAVMGSDLSADNNVQAQVTVKNIDGRTLTASDGQTYKIDTQVNATDDTNTAIEDQAANATSGNVLTNDDQDGTQVTTTDVTGTYGVFHFKADGSYTYELDNSKVQQLNVNDHVTDTVPYSITDGAGNQTTANIAVNIVGTNDAAVITGDSTADLTEDNLIHGAGNYLYTQGTLASADVDNLDNSFQKESLSVDVNGQPTIGNLMINDKGLWTYNIDNSKIQNLGDGESLVERFVVHSVDGSAHEIVATVHGQTDVPPAIIVNVPSIAPTLAPTLNPVAVPHQVPAALAQHVPATATISINDLTTDNTVNSLEAGQQVHVTGKVSGDVHDGDLVSLSVNGQSYSGKVNGGTFDILVNGSDLSADTSIKAEVTGTSSTGDTSTVSVAHAYSVDTVVDATDDVNAAVEDQSATATAGNVLSNDDQDGTQVTTTDVTGTYGVFHFKADGSYTYELDNSKVQQLNVNDHVTDTVPYSITDGAGNQTTANIAVNIVGTNDAAVISGDSTADLTEDNLIHGAGNYLYTQGKLSSVDVDNPDATFQKESLSVDVNGQPTIGNLMINDKGLWTYNIDNSKIQNLGDGESLVERFVVHSVDGTAHEVIATVHGQTDVPAAIVVNVPNLAPILAPTLNPVAVPHQVPAALAQHVPASATIAINDLTADNIINALESGKQVHITGSVAGDVHDGDLVSLSVNGQSYSAKASAGVFDVLVNGSDLAADNKVHAQVIGTSTTGDTTIATDEHQYQVDLDTDLAFNTVYMSHYGKDELIVQLFLPKDASLSQLEIASSGGGAPIQVDLTSQYSASGSVRQPDHQYIKFKVDVSSLPDGDLHLSAQSVDAAGNSASAVNSSQYTKVILDTQISAADDTNTAVEDQSATATAGNVLSNDDQDGTQVTTTDVTGTYGVFHFKADGSYTYELDNSKVQHLTSQDKVDDLASYSITDAAGNSTTATLTVAITGSDDAAMITDVQNNLNLRGVTEDRGYIDTHYKLHYDGKLNIQDPDQGEGAFDPNIGSQTYQGIGYDTKLGGHILLMRDGHYTYTLDNRNIQNLAVGETQKDSAVIRSADGTTHTIELTVHGTNDTPTIAAQSHTVIEGGNLLHGQMIGQDIDTGAQLHYSTPQIDGLTFNPDGSYSFDPSHLSYQSIASGVTKTLTIPITVTDEHNASSTQNLSISITGANNAASISGVSTGDVDEGHGTYHNRSPNYAQPGMAKLTNDPLYADGKLEIIDPDTGEAQFDTKGVGYSYHGTYGQLILNADGNWHYKVTVGSNQQNVATQIDQLGDGQKLTDTITVYSKGGTAHDIVITIHGDNDRPYISSEVTLATSTEDTALTFSKADLLANTIDVDANDAGKLSIANLLVDHGSVVDNKDGTYTFTPTKDYNGKVHFSYDVTDAHGGITHTGASSTLTATPDGAIISEVTTGHVIEDGPHSRHNAGVTTELANGQLQVIDPDSGEDKFQYSQFGESAIHDPFGGMLRIDSAGNWGYSVNNAALQHLAQGQTETVVYRVHSYDGTAYELHIDVVGTNDAPTVSQVTLSNGTEDTHYQMQASQFGFTDIDTGDALHSIAITDLPPATQGKFLLDGHGITAGQSITANDITKLQFMPAQNFNGDVQFKFTVNDGHIDSQEATNTLHFNAVGDAAIISGTATGDVYEHVAPNMSPDYAQPGMAHLTTNMIHTDGKLTIIDPDTGENSFDSKGIGYTYHGKYGHLILNSNGEWFYAVATGTADVNGGLTTTVGRIIDQLGAGEKLTDTVTVQSKDGSTHDIVITIHGDNDRPYCSSEVQLNSGKEDLAQTITASELLANTVDVDTNDIGKLTITNLHVDHGSIRDNHDGSYTLTPEKDYNGQIHFSYDVKDAHGGTTATGASLQLSSTPDAAQITAVGDILQEDHLLSGTHLLHSEGHFQVVDPDGASQSFFATNSAGKDISYTGSLGGTLQIYKGGNYFYDISNYNVDALKAGEVAKDVFTISSADGTTKQVEFTIQGTNDAPYISNASLHQAVMEDGNLLHGTLHGIDPDHGEQQLLTYTSLKAIAGFTLHTNGSYTFDSSDKAYQHASLSVGNIHILIPVQVTDSEGLHTTQNLRINIIPTNDAPIITGSIALASNHEDQTVTLHMQDLLAHASDIDDYDRLQVSALRADHGQVTDNHDGTFTFTPETNFHGKVTFNYSVHDNHGGSTPASATMHLSSINDVPTITVTTLAQGTEDTHYQMQASQFGFTDIDTGDTLHSIAITDLPPATQGKFILDGHEITAGQSIATADISKLQFIPAHNFNGDVNFSYTVNDGHTDSAKATNTLHITPVNDAANIDGQTQSTVSASITEDSATSTISGQLTLIDPDTGEDKFAANTQILGQYGQLAVDEDGSWHYVLNNAATAVNALNSGEQLTDTIVVTSPDGTASETISITIHGHTDTPSLQLQEAGAVQGLNLFAGIQGDGVSQLQYSTDGVNFSNQIPAGFSLASDGHTLEVDPANGSYDHLANGVQHKVWVNYQLQEGTGSNAHQSSQQAQVIITGTSDAPVIHGFTANSDQYSGPVTGNLLQGATDVDDGAQLILQDLQFKDPTTQHYVSVHTGQNFNIKGVGHITIASDGNYTFTPEANFSGDVPGFIYRVVDTHGDYKDESQNTLKIHIDANHQPTVQTLTASTAEETDYQFSAASFGYQDADGDAMAELTITQLPDPTNGHLLLNGQTITQGQAISSNDIGKLIFKPAANFNGDAHFSYVTNDGHQDSAAHTAVLTVTAVNDLPVLTINQTSHTQGNLVATDVDTGDTHTFSAPVLTGSFGSLSVDPDSGAYIYTQNNSVAHMTYNPATSTYSGVDVFEVQVSDNHGGMASQFISFTAQATLSSTAGTVVITSSVPTQPVITNTLPSTNVVATALTNNVSIDLSAASDSGSVDNDNLTNDITPTIVGHTDMPFSRVTIYDGNTTVGHALSDASGDYSVTLSGLSEGLHNLSAKALAPSSAVPTVSSGLDVQIDTQVSTSIQVDPITADNVINAQESHSDVNVTGQVGGDAQLGDIVTLTLNQHSYTGTVDSNGQFSIQVAGAELASNSAISASVSTTDKAGNSAQASQVLHYDTDLQAGRPSITFENPGSDNLYSKAEIAHGHADTITATVHAAADAKAGEHLNINGVDHILDTNSLANGISLEVAPSSIIKAIMTDEHGNVNSALNMAASAKPEPIVVTAPSGSHHIAATLGVPTITPSQTPVPVDQQGWKILVNGHYQTSYSSHWGTLTINPKTGELNYQEHANTHTGPHGSSTDVGVHEDRFEVALQGSHHDDIVMHVQVSILSHGPGHSGKLTLGSEVLDMTVTPTFNHPAPPPPPPADAYDEPQSDATVELSVGISDIVIDDEAQSNSTPEAIPTTQAEVDSTTANAPIDHYLQMVGISQQQLAPQIESAKVDDIPSMQELASTGSDADMLDTNQVDVFASPLEDDDKHGLNHDNLSVLDDSSEHQVIDPINDDDSLHQALNDMHSQI